MTTSGISGGGSQPWLVVGGGNMARAIIEGGRAAGRLDPGRVLVAEPDPAKRDTMAGLGCKVAATAGEALARAGEIESEGTPAQVLLAVKPQSLAGLEGEIAASLVGASRVVVTILAGTPGARVRAALGGGVRVVRAMPNLAAQIGRGVTAVCLCAGAKPGDEAAAMELFRGVGPVVVPLAEELMDAFTAVAGSGPAYVFYLAEAMVLAAERLGMERSVATRVVRETIAGSGELLARSDAEAAELRRAVTSKAGVTAAVTGAMDAAGVMSTIVRAIEAGRDRGRELARG